MFNLDEEVDDFEVDTEPHKKYKKQLEEFVAIARLKIVGKRL